MHSVAVPAVALCHTSPLALLEGLEAVLQLFDIATVVDKQQVERRVSLVTYLALPFVVLHSNVLLLPALMHAYNTCQKAKLLSKVPLTNSSPRVSIVKSL